MGHVKFVVVISVTNVCVTRYKDTEESIDMQDISWLFARKYAGKDYCMSFLTHFTKLFQFS